MQDGYLVENETSYPTREVKRIARWVLRELDVEPRHRALVRVKHTTGSYYQGRCYINAHRHGAWVWSRRIGQYTWAAPNVPASASHLLVCRIPKPGAGFSFHDRGLKGGPPPCDPATWQECLVAIAAHEAQHLRAHVIVKRRGNSEVDCEWAEYRLLQRWREVEARRHGRPHRSRAARPTNPRG